MAPVPILTDGALAEKSAMLDALRDMEVAATLLGSAGAPLRLPSAPLRFLCADSHSPLRRVSLQ